MMIWKVFSRTGGIEGGVSLKKLSGPIKGKKSGRDRNKCAKVNLFLVKGNSNQGYGS